jgi:hypothetical protein
MAGYLDSVNRTKVSPELLGEVWAMQAAMSPKDRDLFDVRAIRLFELLAAKRLVGDENVLALAINCRLQALTAIAVHDNQRGWVFVDAAAGMPCIEADLMQAAAEEPVIEGLNHQAIFDATRFQRRMRRIAEAKGRA